VFQKSEIIAQKLQ